MHEIKTLHHERRAASEKAWGTRLRTTVRCPLPPLLCIALMWTAFSCAGGVFASPTEAETQYILTKGQGVEVCEAYKQNLNSFHHLAPMWCGRELNPALPDFRKPTWQQLNVWEYREVVKDIQRFLEGIEPDDPHNILGWEQGIKDRMKHHHLRMELALIDIDNDGYLEPVIRYFDGSCPMTSTYAIPILVLNERKDGLEVKKTMQLMQNPRLKVEGMVYRPTQTWGGAMYDVFLYKNSAYFDRLRIDREPRKGILQVFMTAKKHTQEICTYRYHFNQ